MSSANVPATSKKSGSWLVVGLLALGVVALIFVRMFHLSSPDILQQDGLPAARQGMQLSQEGKKLLSLEEQREMEGIYAEAFKALSPEEHARFMVLAQKGPAATDAEITETATLLDKALRSLTSERGARLWALIGKAVELAQQQRKTMPSP